MDFLKTEFNLKLDSVIITWTNFIKEKKKFFIRNVYTNDLFIIKNNIFLSVPAFPVAISSVSAVDLAKLGYNNQGDK